MNDDNAFLIIGIIILAVYLPSFYLTIRHYHKRKEMIPKKILVSFPICLAIVFCIVATILIGEFTLIIIGGILATSFIYALVMYVWSFVYYRSLRISGYTDITEKHKGPDSHKADQFKFRKNGE
jgi:hypothetical protein